MIGKHINPARLSPESLAMNILPGRSSGLFPVYCLPITHGAWQWPQCKQFCLFRLSRMNSWNSQLRG